MFTPLFILAFACYLLSLALALAGTFLTHIIPRIFINFSIVIHFLLLAAFIINFRYVGSIVHPAYANYIFLSFFCFGIITAGMIMRNKYPVFIKVYFILFLISLPLFIISPSRLLGFIVTGDINALHRERIHVSGNYFLVAQTDHRNNVKQLLPYKLTREMGMFHRTLQRDILLPETCDSVRIIDRTKDYIRIRVYYSDDHVKDSIDKTLGLNPVLDSTRVITRQPQKISKP